MKKYDYKDVVEKICIVFNNSFQTDYKIIFQSREEAEALNPDIKNLSKSAGGTYQPKNKRIYIFSNVIDEINKKNYNNLRNSNDNGLAFLILACFHELEHRLQIDCPQKLRKQALFSTSMYDIEKIIVLFDKEFYRQNHDNFYMEIDADIKGTENAMKFIDFCKIDGINRDYFEALRTYNKYRQLNYDIPQFIKRFNNIVRMYPQILQDKRFISNENILSFYDENGRFKPIDEIMKKPNVFLTPYIISSEMFLKSINIKTISQEQRNFILKNINMVVVEHKIKKQALDKLKPEAKKAIEELNKYTHFSKSPSLKTVEFFADEKYYQFLKNNVQTYSKIVSEGDEQEP